MRRPTIALAGAVFVLALFPAMAHAQYPPQEPVCLADTSTASPGDAVRITGDGWSPGSVTDIDFHQTNPPLDRDLGEADANDAGTFVVTVHVPAAAHAGAATIVLTGNAADESNATCTIDLTITSGAPRATCAQVSDDVVTRGQTIVVFSAKGRWKPGTEVKVFFRSTPVRVATTTAEEDGSFSTDATIPEDATVGDHLIQVLGTAPSGGPDGCSIPIEVVASRGGGGLSGTGIAVWGFLAVAVALLGSGSSMLVAARAVPADSEHPAVRQERHRRHVRAALAMSGGTAAFAGWLLVAALHPGAPEGLSLRHPLSVATILLALGAVWAARSANRPDRPE
ncbi:MAG: hypothetical protein LC722_00425 [Actinobacteria bacterium]|nr:hypothetical protein [Actinomycetota bacterium]